MNNQEVADTQERDFSSSVPSKHKKIIHFSSGETLEEDDSEEEEELSSKRLPFNESIERISRFSFKNVAILVGRISLLACDFLGERLAGALGLNAAKYQYAIDQHQHDHKKASCQIANDRMEGQAEAIHLSSELDGSYGATGGTQHPADAQDVKHMSSKGYNNRSYQAD